jgi:hypothetical protein
VLALTSISLIPIGNWVTIGGARTPLEITDVNIGLLILLGIGSLGVYGVALAGWASNSKYSLLGGLRASAQMVSYELPLGLSLVGVLIQARSFSLRSIVDAQAGTFWGYMPRWNVFYGQEIGFLIYLISAFAETNRLPFDLPEAETETGGGLSHRIQLDEVRHFLHDGIRSHDHGFLPSHAALSGRMARAVVRHPAASGSSSSVLVRAEGFWLHAALHLGARHVAAFPVRPAYGVRLEVSASTVNDEPNDDWVDRGMDVARLGRLRLTFPPKCYKVLASADAASP